MLVIWFVVVFRRTRPHWRVFDFWGVCTFNMALQYGVYINLVWFVNGCLSLGYPMLLPCFWYSWVMNVYVIWKYFWWNLSFFVLCDDLCNDQHLDCSFLSTKPAWSVVSCVTYVYCHLKSYFRKFCHGEFVLHSINCFSYFGIPTLQTLGVLSLDGFAVNRWIQV